MRQNAGEHGVTVGQERGQHRQARPRAHGFVLRRDAGAAKREALGLVQSVQKLQLFGEQQIVHIAHERMVAQIFARGHQRLAGQVFTLAVQIQAVVRKPAHDHRAACGPLQRYHDVRLAPRQVQHARQRQQVNRQMRVLARELCQVRRQNQRAKPLGCAHPHQA